MASDTIPTTFFVMSDTHDLDPDTFKQKFSEKPLPKIDVLLHCGDLTEYGGLENYRNAIRLMASIDAEKRLFIAGNHDVSLDPDFHTTRNLDACPAPTECYDEAMEVCAGDFAKDLGVTYLTEGMHTFQLTNGAEFTIYASPYSTKHGEWAFQHPTNEDRHNDPSLTRTDRTVVSTGTSESIIPAFSTGVHIIMTHGPPRYMFDSFGQGGNSGCESLLRATSRARPLMHCFGHMHTGWGARVVKWHSPQTGSKRKYASDHDECSSRSKKLKEGSISESRIDGDQEWVKEEQSPKWVGKNSVLKKGYAEVKRAELEFEHGEATWMVNAAVQDGDGEMTQVPWLVELALPRSSAR